MPETSSSASRSTPLPLLIYVLTTGVFLMGTTEFIVAGILPQIADSIGIRVADAGLMITVFAIGMIVGTPLMAIATLRMQRRLALALSLVVFAIGHVVVAITTSFPLILTMRFVTALATGTFWAVAAVVAAQAVGPKHSSRALGIVLGGGMLANVVGVPLGGLAGHVLGWRSPFWALAILALLVALVIRVQVPHTTDDRSVPSVRREIAGLADVRIWLVLSGAAIVCGSSLAAYTFISPLLTAHTGIAASAVPLVLLAYGVGALIGSTYGGRLGSDRPYGVLFTAATGTFLVLIGLALLSHSPAATVVLVFLLGLFGMSTNPILVGKAVTYADEAPTLASALSTSAFNVGTAVGSWIAGFALESALGPIGPVVVGAAIASLYFVPLSLLLVRDRCARMTLSQRTLSGPDPR